MNITVLRFDELGSTNTEAANQARQGVAEGLCIVARQQTAGRGRHGRVWVSPPDAGLYFSIVLRPKIEMRFLPLITLTAAVAAHDLLEETCGLDADIKWVNDIHVNGKKISGILAETSETKSNLAVILGIGINLRADNFPPEIADIATSIESETGQPPDREIVLQNLTRLIAENYERLQSDGGAEAIREKWALRSSYHYGKEVRVVTPNENIVGTTCGLEENGALRVQQPDGQVRIVQAGEVENLRAS
jgi:BirA family biotin operon repressor/biotin-[acetyl-CoA-carboxylase] ligase